MHLFDRVTVLAALFSHIAGSKLPFSGNDRKNYFLNIEMLGAGQIIFDDFNEHGFGERDCQAVRLIAADITYNLTFFVTKKFH